MGYVIGAEGYRASGFWGVELVEDSAETALRDWCAGCGCRVMRLEVEDAELMVYCTALGVASGSSRVLMCVQKCQNFPLFLRQR